MRISKRLLNYLSIALFLSLPASALPEFMETEDTKFAVSPIVDVRAIDNSETLLVTAQYPNSCYEPGNAFKQLGPDNKLALFNFAEVTTDEVCLRVISYSQFRLSVSELKNKDYKLVDGFDGEKIATLSINSDEIQLRE